MMVGQSRTGWMPHPVLRWFSMASLLAVLCIAATGWAAIPGAQVPDPASAAKPAPGLHAPADAPRLSDRALQQPSPPAGFNRYDAGWIHFAYPPEVRERIQVLIDNAESARTGLMARLGTPVLRHLYVRVARTPGEMATLAPSGAAYPKYAAAVAYPDLDLVLLTLQPLYPNEHHDILEVFIHEMAHVALHDAVRGHPVPLWFNEGFAVFASGESSIVRLQTLWTATLAGTLMPLTRLESAFPRDAQTASIAYAEAADVVRYLVRTEDRYRFDGLVSRLAKGVDFGTALAGAYGIDLASLESEWRSDLGRRYTFWPVLASTSVLWFGIVGLCFWAIRKRRSRNQAILERWSKEEAEQDEFPAIRETSDVPPRVHIVLAGVSQRRSGPPPVLGVPESEVPKVVHDGQLHTLH